jgi:hypothetical protein
VASTLTWLDFSEHERRQALDVIDLFREKDTRDELGIGTVRDALADLLFPGTSTIQTRARYFLFIPWLYRRLERQKAAVADAARFARREEIRLINALAGAGETEGVIGIEARETLKRLPSNVYWQGLAAWGIRTLDISQSDYHRFFASFASKATQKREAEDEGDRQGPGRVVWHSGLPEAPADFPDKAAMDLRKVDAEYLRERILLRQGGTLLAYLVDRVDAPSTCEYPWEHPLKSALPEKNAHELEHARKFAVVMHGARLLYNLLLGEASASEETIDRFRGEMDDWAAEIEGERAQFIAWDRQGFWALVTSVNRGIGMPARLFINAWVDLVLANDANALKELPRARALVSDRERRLKGSLSRLVNARALELWGGESGAYRDSFRWFKVQVIVNDIVRGLRGA